jgi:hypothetical protein
MTESAAPRVIESLHAPDGLYCVDVIATAQGFALQVCRRDEGSWHVIDRRSDHPSREKAFAEARSIITALS